MATVNNCLLFRTDQPLSDAFLRDVGTAVANQTTNLNRIGLYLGLRNADIVEINRHFHFPEEQAFHMLRLWSRRQERKRATLKIILTQAGIKLDLLTAGVAKKKTTGWCNRSLWQASVYWWEGKDSAVCYNMLYIPLTPHILSHTQLNLQELVSTPRARKSSTVVVSA